MEMNAGNFAENGVMVADLGDMDDPAFDRCRRALEDRRTVGGLAERLAGQFAPVDLDGLEEGEGRALLAFGKHKAAAVRDTVEGPVTAQVTASALQLHREVIGIFDEEAASLLARRTYYADVEKAQTLLEAGEFKQLGIGTR